MAPVLLACPACKKRISSSYSAHNCPHCGEPLSNEWEETGRKELRRRRIGLGFLLASVSFAIGAVITDINTSPRQAAVQMPTTSLLSTPAPPKVSQAKVRAFGFRPGNGQRGLFVAIREKEQTLGGQQIRVLCPADGTGEIVAALNGEYVAVKVASRGWARSEGLWAVEGRILIPVSDSGIPNDVPKRLEVLEPHIDAIIETGVQMCPLAEPAGESAWKSLRSAVTNYETNARSLGISIP